MSVRLFGLALVLTLLAAPALAVAASEACSPCCSAPVERACDADEAPCGALVAASCCAADPALHAPSILEASPTSPAAVAPRALSPVSVRAHAPGAAVELASLRSPLHRSVVLRL